MASLAALKPFLVDCALIGLVAASFGLAKKLMARKCKLPLPPGPKGLPLIGNLDQMPHAFEWVKYHEWCKEFDTDILHLNIAGTHMIVLDTSAAATDLLESRSSIYSGRPRLPMINELMGWDFNLGFMPYGSNWRKHRRHIHHSFHPGAVRKFYPHITKATRNFMNRLLENPDSKQFMLNLRHLAGETIMSIAYGIDIQQENDPYVLAAEAGVHPMVAAGVPGAFLVDSFPILKHVPAWIPGASFKRKAREWRKVARTMIEMPYTQAKKMFESGHASVSIVSTDLRRIESGLEDEAFTEEVIQNSVGSLYAAGSDTTVSAISSCILGLLERPDVLKRAQAELDSVIGLGQLPTIEDEPALPYITAIAKETLRWRDVAPIAVPHFLSEEDEYKGYRLPAGSLVVGNSWAMLHDERVYEDPFTFNPDRFINPNTGQIDYTSARDPAHACWGFGRRICAARFMAWPAVWLAIASLIACFDIEKAKITVKSEDGEDEEREVELSHEYVSALIVMPKPFDFLIRPRSKDHEDLVRSSVVHNSDL